MFNDPHTVKCVFDMPWRDDGSYVLGCWAGFLRFFFKSYKSSSIQSLYKHMRQKHKEETDKFKQQSRVNSYHIYKLEHNQGKELHIEANPELKFLRRGPHFEERADGETENSWQVRRGKETATETTIKCHQNGL